MKIYFRERSVVSRLSQYFLSISFTKKAVEDENM